MSNRGDQYKYEQKKINHVFHYTSDFTDLQKIVSQGFIPSYCKEEIATKNYLTPMVSFCNIPIAEVDRYMRYGKNGIGMSLEWAINNALSPVTYTHKNSPYNSVLGDLSMIKMQIGIDNITKDRVHDPSGLDLMTKLGLDKLSLTNKANLKILQFLKNWETNYRGEKIITYQEREWRFVPNDARIVPIIEEGEDSYVQYSDKKMKPKPHLSEYPLEIKNLDDIRYIVVTTDLQRDKILKSLNKSFSEKKTTAALLLGKLSILTAGQIRNDF